MSEFSERVKQLVRDGHVRISEHAFDELAEDGLSVRDAINGVEDMIVVEEYLQYPKGSCLLAFESDVEGHPFHVVWGVPKGYTEPAVLITAYRPDPHKWDSTFTRRIG